MTHLANIAVIESQPSLVNILRSALEKTDIGISQIELAESCLQNLDASLIVVDLFLEDMDGLTLIEKIRLKNKNIPVVGFVSQAHISALDMDEQVLRDMVEKSGANALFLAPLNLGEVVNTIDRLLCIKASEVA